MKVIITGFKGMLGSELFPYLKEFGLEVVGWDLPEWDITKREVVSEGIRREEPEAIIHLAAFTDVDRGEVEKEKAYKINFEGTLNLTLAAREINCKFLYLSTDYVFDGEKGSPYIETDVPKPINYYGWTKYLGEEVVGRELERYFIVRTAWLYSRKGKNFVRTIKEKAERGEDLRVVDDQFGSPTWVRDLCEPIRNLILSEYYGIYHITNSGFCSWFQFAQEILQILGMRREVQPIKSEEVGRLAKRPKFSVLANEVYKRLFGRELRQWDSALKECLSSPD